MLTALCYAWAGVLDWEHVRNRAEMALGAPRFLTADPMRPAASRSCDCVCPALTEGSTLEPKPTLPSCSSSAMCSQQQEKEWMPRIKASEQADSLHVLFRPHKILRCLESSKKEFCFASVLQIHTFHCLFCWVCFTLRKANHRHELPTHKSQVKWFIISMIVFPMIPLAPWKVKKLLQALDFYCVVQVKYNLHIF